MAKAIEKAEEMRVKKIASLKKQIEKLEKLNFKKEEYGRLSNIIKAYIIQ